jgi:hypothetical protein
MSWPDPHGETCGGRFVGDAVTVLVFVGEAVTVIVGDGVGEGVSVGLGVGSGPAPAPDDPVPHPATAKAATARTSSAGRVITVLTLASERIGSYSAATGVD